MASLANDIFEQLLVSNAASYEATQLWTQAVKALEKMPSDIDPHMRDRIFDRFLEDDARALYRRAHTIKPEHRPSLFEALGRCRDVEATFLLEAGLNDFDEAAALLKVLANASNCPLLIGNLAKGTEGRSKAALAACVEVVRAGYPLSTSVSFAGMFGAVMLFGSLAQTKVILAIDPPPHAVAWLRSTAKKMPKDRRALVLKRIEGIEDGDSPDDGLGPARYERLDQGEQLEKREPTAPRLVVTTTIGKTSTATHDSLLAAVYASPEDDAPRAVYADWLLENGYPLGEFIRLQLMRASGKKGTGVKEKIILEAAKGSFWPDHPTTIGGHHSPNWEWTERGFPCVFQGDMMQKEVREKLRANPGWSTIRDLWCDYREPACLDGLDLPPMPSLRTIRSVGLGALEVIASKRSRDVPIEMLELDLAGLPPKTLVTSFERLKRVELQCKATTVGDAVTRLTEVGLLKTANELWLRFSEENQIPLALEIFANKMPAQIQLLELGTFYRLVRVTRTVAANEKQKAPPSLEVVAEQSELDDLLAQLAALPPSSVSSVHVILAAGGFYTKKTRPLAEKQAKDVLKRFAKSSVSSPTR